MLRLRLQVRVCSRDHWRPAETTWLHCSSKQQTPERIHTCCRLSGDGSQRPALPYSYNRTEVHGTKPANLAFFMTAAVVSVSADDADATVTRLAEANTVQPPVT